MYLSVTGLTQAHEVVHRVRSTLRDRQDVVNLLHRSQPSFPQTHLAERMCRGVSVTDTSPRMTVLLVYVGTAFVLVILAAFFYTVLVTVLSVTEVRTTWVGTRSFGFVWHAASPFHDKSHRGISPDDGLYAFLHDTIIPHRRRKVVHDITHLSPHRSKAGCGHSSSSQKPPWDFSRRWLSTQSCMILLYHIAVEKSSTILLIICHTEAKRDVGSHDSFCYTRKTVLC